MKKIKTEWNFTLFYKNQKDPQIEADIVSIEKACESFEKKYLNNNSYLSDTKSLLNALKEYQKVLEIIGSSKPLAYFYLLKDVNTGNSQISASISKLSERITRATNKILFFTLSLGKIEKDFQNKIKSDANFLPFLYFLEQLWLQVKYQLSVEEEKIMNLKYLTSYELWVRQTEKILGEQKITFEKKEMSLSEAGSLVYKIPREKSLKLYNLIVLKRKEIAHFIEPEINAIILDKKIDDELRGYNKPYSATVIGYQNTEREFELLKDTVTKYFPIAQKFFKLKKNILGLEKLKFIDSRLPLYKTKKEYSFEDSVNFVHSAFSKVSDEYSNILKDFVSKGQIDVYPRKQKSAGGYCWSGYSQPTFILLNHTGSFNDVNTLAHEMGHAIHNEYSQNQNILYVGHTISVAEVASTLFENFAFEELFKTLPEKDKLFALHDKIQDSLSTIFLQIACINFEIALHEKIGKEGTLSHEQIAKLYSEKFKEYLGKDFDIKDDDGYLFVNHMHLRWYFYNYSYAYGELVSRVLYQKYKEDNTFIEKINEFLSAGESMSPENIFKSIGIDVSHPDFFEGGLKSIEKEIDEFEKLLKQSQTKTKNKKKSK